MKKLVIAAICCGVFTITNPNSIEAAEQSVNTVQTSESEMQEVDIWSHEMRKIFGRNRRDKDDDDRYRHHHHHGHDHRYGDHRRGHYPPPPPPPPPRHRHHYAAENFEFDQFSAEE